MSNVRDDTPHGDQLERCGEVSADDLRLDDVDDCSLGGVGGVCVLQQH
jgi:hypothetical protein